MQEQAFLTWIGGRFPDDVPMRADEQIHEMTPSGVLVCRCGERHVEVPRSQIVVRAAASGGLAVWMSNRTGGTRRVLDGRHDPLALALHLRSLRLEEAPHDDPVFASLVDASAVRFFASEGSSTEEVVDRIGTWLASQSSAFMAHACFVGDHSLRAIAALGERVGFGESVSLGLVPRPNRLRASVLAGLRLG